MLYRVLADFIVLMHFAFILFVVLGGFLVFRWVRCAWIHLPVVLWAALIEFFGWLCPLTPLERWLRVKGGGIAYQSGFVEHYIIPLIYPETLTRSMQIVLGLFVLSLNFGIYAWIIWHRANKNIRNDHPVFH